MDQKLENNIKTVLENHKVENTEKTDNKAVNDSKLDKIKVPAAQSNIKAVDTLDDNREKKTTTEEAQSKSNAGIQNIDIEKKLQPSVSISTAIALKDERKIQNYIQEEDIEMMEPLIVKKEENSITTINISPKDDLTPVSLCETTDDKTQSSIMSSSAASTPATTPPAEHSPPSQDQKLSSSTGESPQQTVASPKISPVETIITPSLSSGDGNNCIAQPINVLRNGTIPNAGKPLLSTMSKKLEKSARTGRSRKPKSLVAMYESEISENQTGIKLCIKKSDNSLSNITATAMAAVAKAISKSSSSSSSSTTVKNRKSSRSLKQRIRLTSDDEAADGHDYEPKRKKERSNKKITFVASAVSRIDGEVKEPIEQSVWGSRLPEPILFKIFQMIVDKDGCMPTLLRLGRGAPNLKSITLAGWKGFTSDHLIFMVENMKKLERLDLSSINVEMNASKSAVGGQSLCNALQVMGGRLTHLYLAHNRLACIPQVVNILSTHAPNLQLLDLSNVSTQATSHGILHIEKLQQGCPKLKVLRITNSHITLCNATMQEMMDSPGFPNLEELSVAVLTGSRVIGDEHLQRILKSSSKLKLLDVRCCTRLTHESLIRLPAWDIKHLFLSGCSVTRDTGSGLELIASKWAHSLIELDLAWANVQQPLDNALHALADKGAESRLAHLNLCGSSVSEEAVKEILANCALMSSINLSSCRGLPRGVKRLMQGPQQLNELREVLKVQLKVKLPDSSASNNTQISTTAINLNNEPINNSGGVGADEGGGDDVGVHSP
uniref:F-box domain-containing protein n=1 Tax=Glossina palpalis gambiensis TaxID=67801 RepID=A0A1B0BT15_9MUSC